MNFRILAKIYLGPSFFTIRVESCSWTIANFSEHLTVITGTGDGISTEKYRIFY